MIILINQIKLVKEFNIYIQINLIDNLFITLLKRLKLKKNLCL